jgi:hypothetical protein
MIPGFTDLFNLMSASSESAKSASQLTPPQASAAAETSLNRPARVSPQPSPDAQPAEISRKHPIPPPSERLQYRAIGLVRGRYQASEEQFNRGILLAEDGSELDAVLLGQVMSLVKKHLDLSQNHLWVVYPRTREKQQSLHLQIVGVWEPEQLNQDLPALAESPMPADGYFSVRGEIIFHSQDKGFVVVKIQQAARKDSDPAKFFKVRVEGTITLRPGYFWDLEAQRQDNQLILVKATAVALLPPKKPSKTKSDRPKTIRDRPSSPPGGHTGYPPGESEPRKTVTKPVKRYPESSV